MPKISKGRLDGTNGMSKFTASELHSMADEHLQMISDPNCQDDNRWLTRRERSLRSLAIKKEKSIEHKNRQ
jgi:hypothetical protein